LRLSDLKTRLVLRARESRGTQPVALVGPQGE
jgi:hypothetical protein